MTCLTLSGVQVVAKSSVFKTPPLGGGRQPAYLNAVIVVSFFRSPRRLLQIAKSIERRSGRRPVRRWGPRTLDIDVIDAGQTLMPVHIKKLARHSLTTPLILPHPQAHRRSFVLVPLKQVRPNWHHPRTRRSIDQMLRSIPPAERRSITPVADL